MTGTALSPRRLIRATSGCSRCANGPRPSEAGLGWSARTASARKSAFVYPAKRSGAWAFPERVDVVDELERLVDAYRMLTATSVASKLAVLMDLEQIRDPRVVRFLLKVFEDRNEPQDVRIHVLKQLRNGGGLLMLADRLPVAMSIGDVLA